MPNKPTQKRLQELFSYDPDTGVLSRKIAWYGFPVGTAVGTASHGHLMVSVDGVRYLVHRVIWCWMTGTWPELTIDHINHVGMDNRWANLRQATYSQQIQNTRARKDNKSGHRGVFWDSSRKRWQAQIRGNGLRQHLGYFQDFEEAKLAYQTAAKQLHGEFHAN